MAEKNDLEQLRNDLTGLQLDLDEKGSQILDGLNIDSGIDSLAKATKGLSGKVLPDRISIATNNPVLSEVIDIAYQKAQEKLDGFIAEKTQTFTNNLRTLTFAENLPIDSSGEKEPSIGSLFKSQEADFKLATGSAIDAFLPTAIHLGKSDAFQASGKLNFDDGSVNLRVSGDLSNGVTYDAGARIHYDNSSAQGNAAYARLEIDKENYTANLGAVFKEATTGENIFEAQAKLYIQELQIGENATASTKAEINYDNINGAGGFIGVKIGF